MSTVLDDFLQGGPVGESSGDAVVDRMSLERGDFPGLDILSRASALGQRMRREKMIL